MFEKNVKDVEREIRKTEIWIDEIRKKKNWILSKINQIEDEYQGPYKNTFKSIIKELYEIEREKADLERKLTAEMISNFERSGKGIVDVTKVDPKIVREYKEIFSRLKEIQKQVEYLTKISDKEKMRKVIALNNEYSKLSDKEEKLIKKLWRLRRAKK